MITQQQNAAAPEQDESIMVPFSEQNRRWSRLAGRSMSKFEQMLIGRPFRYSSYWGRWTRVIKPIFDGHPYGMIELNLTPMPGVPSSTWKNDVAPMYIRRHMTNMDRKDQFVVALPRDIMVQLTDAVGHEQAVFMTQSDLWPYIDADKLFQEDRRAVHINGIPFNLIRRKGMEGSPE